MENFHFILPTLMDLVSLSVSETVKRRGEKKKKERELAEEILPDLAVLCEKVQEYVNQFSAKINVEKYNEIFELLKVTRYKYKKYIIYLPDNLSSMIDSILLDMNRYCNRYTYLKDITELNGRNHIPYHTQEDVKEKRIIDSIVRSQLPKDLKSIEDFCRKRT